MKSSLPNMVTVLAAITLISSTAVGVVYRFTQDPIRQAQENKVTDAIRAVLPPFTNTPSEEADTLVPADGGNVPVILYPARNGEQAVGCAVETFSPKGYGGTVRLLVGFLPDGTIYNTEVISHNETPGLGNKMEKSKSDFSLQFNGKNPKDYALKVKKDGGDVDAITAATISSRAFSDAVQRAYDTFMGTRTDTSTGATATEGKHNDK